MFSSILSRSMAVAARSSSFRRAALLPSASILSAHSQFAIDTTVPRAFSSSTSNNSQSVSSSELFQGWNRGRMGPSLLVGGAAILGAGGLLYMYQTSRKAPKAGVEGPWNPEDIPIIRKDIQTAEMYQPGTIFLAHAYMALAEALIHGGDCEGGVKAFEKAIAIQRRLCPEGDLHLALCYVKLGGAKLRAGSDVNEVLREFDKARDIAENSLKDEIEKKTVYMFLGDEFHTLGLLRASLQEYKRAVAATAKGISADLRIGWTLSKLGDSQGALKHYRTIQKKLQEVGDLHGVHLCHVCIGLELSLQGDWEGAMNECHEALEIYEKLSEPESVELKPVYFIVGLLLGHSNRASSESIELLRLALRISKQARLYDPLFEAICHFHIGTVLIAQGDYETALGELREALAICEAANKPDHFLSAEARDAIAYVVERQGRSEGASQEGYESGVAEFVLRDLIQDAVIPEHPLVTRSATSS